MPKINIPKSDAFSYLGFDLQDVHDMTQLSNFGTMWLGRLQFVIQLQDMNRHELSARQKGYAARILDDLDDKRRKDIL